MARPILAGSSAVPAVALAALLAAACVPAENQDVELRHPIEIEQRAVTLAFKATPTSRRLDPQTASELDAFFDGYIRDGGVRVFVTTPPRAASGPRSTLARAITARAERRGIGTGEIAVMPAKSGTGADRSYRLRYLRHWVAPQQCEDWSTSFHFNPLNRVHPNFGCATQNYVGRMATRPADLVVSGPLGARDATRSNAVIDNYRRGEPTGAKQAPEESVITTQSNQ